MNYTSIVFIFNTPLSAKMLTTSDCLRRNTKISTGFECRHFGFGPGKGMLSYVVVVV